jgi:RNA polymerase sigma factor (sigma-70 family)
MADVRSLTQRDVVAPTDFESFFRSEYHRLVRALVLVAGSQPEAEELAQESMARVCERWERISHMASPTGYVYRVAFNLHRRRLTRASRERTAAPAEGGSVDPIATRVTRVDVLRAVRSLPVRQREALVLVEWLGMTSSEAASVMGSKPGTIRSLLHDARRSVARALGRDYA